MGMSTNWAAKEGSVLARDPTPGVSLWVVTPTPTPTLPADAHALAADADRYFKEALERQREGDWAGYGESLEKLQQTLQQLVEKTGP